MNTMTEHQEALAYEVKGSGEPVLLISNGPIARTFQPFLEEPVLFEQFQLITYRQRRMSTNGHGPVPVTYAEHAADAAALLKHLGIRRAHIAGHSTGGVIALQLALDYPDLVHSLALLEPLLMDVPGAANFLERMGPALSAYAAGDAAGAMARFLSVACSLDWEACRATIERHVPGGVTQALTDARDVFESYVPALGTWQFGAAEAATIHQPVLSVLGMETDGLFVEGYDLLHAWFPRAEDCAIEGAAHLLHMQRPEPVARGVAGFFARHPIGGQ